MSILDAITGNASKTAARNNAYAISSGQNLAGSALTTGFGNAQKLLGTGDGSGGNALAALGQTFGQARDDLEGADNTTQSYLSRIGSVYGGLTDSGRLATDARSDALGLNGADGNARASEAFKGSLGYGAGLDTGLDSVMRSASARGNLAGGNTSRDLFDYGADYQNKQAGSYINNLTTAGQNYATGAAGQAQGLSLQGGASQAQGGALANLGQSLGQNQAGIYGAASNQQTQFGNAVSGLQTNTANALTQNNNTLAASQTAASSNILGGALGGLSSIFGAAGKAGGFTNLFK